MKGPKSRASSLKENGVGAVHLGDIAVSVPLTRVALF